MLPDDDGATIPDDAAVLDSAEASDDRSAKSVIEKGASLLDTYRIESNAIEGGMGAVWRVHHTGWNVDLAKKRPKASFFQSGKAEGKLRPGVRGVDQSWLASPYCILLLRA